MKKIRMKFTKLDEIKFISHLDLLKLYERALRRADIKLVFSQGFNPHPKISFAHPLTLGISSEGEYVEIEIEDDIDLDIFKKDLNNQMPKGLCISDCRFIEGKTKPLMAVVEYGEYTIKFNLNEKIEEESIYDKLKQFLSLQEIIIVKKSKKSRKNKFREINIRGLIHSLDIIDVDEKKITIKTIIKTGSNDNLKPNVLLNSFADTCNVDIDLNSIRIHRHDLYVDKNDDLINLFNI